MGLLARPLPLFVVSALVAAALSALALALVTAIDSDPADTGTRSEAVSTPTIAPPTPSATTTPTPQVPGDLAGVQIAAKDLPQGDYSRYSVNLTRFVQEVQDYWASWFAGRGVAWVPPLVHPRAELVPDLVCDGRMPGVQGSYYCTPDNFIALAETGQTLPIYVHIGSYGLATVVSHEFGHAVQRALDLDHERSSSKELQADCFAGAWFQAYQEKGGFVDREVPFSQAIDAMGTTDQGEDLSERSESFTAGFDGGPDACIAGFPEDGLRTIAR
ncbi:MAG TPA: neutral zinc metallopeptidase [Dehalococcoidia bacterium]|nr:neutral zinc metallopeptidase [Dehalococcoidia bacterium]